MLLQGQTSLPFSIDIVITGSNRSPFFVLQWYYRVKLDSFSIYKVFTGSNQSSFFALQCYYGVKSVSLFRFTMLLQGQTSLPFSIYNVKQGQISLPFSIYNVITGSNQSPLFDLQCYYRVKSVSPFRFTVLLQGQIGLSFRFTRFLQGQIGLPFSIYNVITGSNWSLFFDLQDFNRVNSVSLFRFSVFLQCEMIPSLFDLQGFHIIFTGS